MMFAIGDKLWPGISKLVEELGELLQEVGKLIGSRGDTNHWSGDLRPRILDEIADVEAAIMFVRRHNLTPEENEYIRVRGLTKTATFERWHMEDAE